MSCDEFIAALSANERPTSQLGAHAASCAGCARLFRASLLLRGVGPRVAPLPAAGPQLGQLFAAQPRAMRSSHPLRRILGVLAIVAACIAVALCCVPRADLHVAAAAPLILPFSALALLLVAGLHLFAYRGRSGLGAPASMRWGFVVAAVALFECLGMLQSAHHVAWNASLGVARVAGSSDCLMLGVLVACLVGAVTFAVGRRMALVGATASGAVGGSVAGLAALMFLHLHCAASDAGHLTVVHALPLVLAIIAGAFAGRRFLAA